MLAPCVERLDLPVEVVPRKEPDTSPPAISPHLSAASNAKDFDAVEKGLRRDFPAHGEYSGRRAAAMWLVLRDTGYRGYAASRYQGATIAPYASPLRGTAAKAPP